MTQTKAIRFRNSLGNILNVRNYNRQVNFKKRVLPGFSSFLLGINDPFLLNRRCLQKHSACPINDLLPTTLKTVVFMVLNGLTIQDCE